jgi:carboxyl-terminal processing protease
MSPESQRTHRAVLIAVSLLLASPASGAFGREKPADEYQPLESFYDALYFIQKHYVDEVESSRLVYDAIEGMTGGLDTPSTYMSPDEYRSFRDDTIGRYYGIGILTRPEADGMVIDRVFDRSPAERAGLLAGDRIVAVDARLLSEDNRDELMAGIKGRRGTIVQLTIDREGAGAPLEFEVARDRIRTPSVESERLPGELGWIRIFQFQENTGREVRRALSTLEGRDQPLEGLVLDLRSNPGGFLDEAVAVADIFLDEGTIVTTRGRAVEEVSEAAHQPGSRTDLRLVVLQDHGTASAAEIVAGALQDHGRATLIGTTSFGKGSVQTTYEFADGSALKLTIARYFTPNDRSIHGTGIQPDQRVSWADADPDEESLPGEPDWSEMPEWVNRDPQMRAAVIALLEDPT